MSKLFVLSFEDQDGTEGHTGYYLSTVKVKDYNFKINGRNCFDHSIRNDKKTYKNIKKISTGHGDDYTTGCQLDYPYFKKHY